MQKDDDPVLEVEFTQTFTVHPPDEVEDGYDAEFFFENRKEQILRDVFDPKRGETEVEIL